MVWDHWVCSGLEEMRLCWDQTEEGPGSLAPLDWICRWTEGDWAECGQIPNQD